MKYEIVEEIKKQYAIVEIPTQQIIRRATKKSKLDKELNLLRSGSGFNGWTPQFFLAKVA